MKLFLFVMAAKWIYLCAKIHRNIYQMEKVNFTVCLESFLKGSSCVFPSVSAWFSPSPPISFHLCGYWTNAVSEKDFAIIYMVRVIPVCGLLSVLASHSVTCFSFPISYRCPAKQWTNTTAHSPGGGLGRGVGQEVLLTQPQLSTMCTLRH